jgi:hypothetical protein
VPLEILDGAFVLFGRFPSLECSEIPAPTSIGILLPRVQPVLARRQFSNHRVLPYPAVNALRPRDNLTLLAISVGREPRSLQAPGRGECSPQGIATFVHIVTLARSGLEVVPFHFAGFPSQVGGHPRLLRDIGFLVNLQERCPYLDRAETECALPLGPPRINACGILLA